MKTTLRLILIALVLLLCFQDARAQFVLGVHGGYSLDAFSATGARKGAYMLGGQARLGLEGIPLTVNPSFDYYFNDIQDINTFQFDINALIPLGDHRSSFMPYIGIGLGVTRVTLEGDVALAENLVAQQHTNSGLNLLGGADLGSGPVRMFLQGRYTMGEHLAFVNRELEGGRGFALQGGLLFRVGH